MATLPIWGRPSGQGWRSLRVKVGLELGVIDEENGERVVRWVTSRRRARDPGFRREVLEAHGHRCAVCGLDARMGQGAGLARSVLLKAAHVRWHSHGGPDAVDNALALCLLHHGALDAGVLGLDMEQRVVVSSRLCGGQAVDSMLVSYAGRAVAGPGVAEVDWARHEGQVFKG